MKITIDRKQLESHLAIIQRITNKKTNIPITGNVAMSFKGKRLTLYATDLEIAYLGHIPVDSHGQKCNLCLPVKTLIKALRAVPKKVKEISFEEQENKWAKINGTISMVGMETTDFPHPPAMPKGKYRKVLDLEGLQRVQCAMLTDEGRAQPSGVFFQFSRGYMVTTDGHRLHLANLLPVSFPDFIMPRDMVRLLMIKAVGKQTTGYMTANDHGCFVKTTHGLIMARHIEGEFPDYEQVVPKQCDAHLILRNKTDLEEIIKEAMPMVSDRYPGMRFHLNGYVKVTATNPEIGEFDKRLDGPYTYWGSDIEVAFNPRYLLEAMLVMPDSDVMVSLVSDIDPAVIENYEQTFKAVIMPMRV